MSEIEVMSRWNNLGLDCFKFPGDGHIYSDPHCESSAITYKTRIPKESSVDMEADVTAYGIVPHPTLGERYHVGFGLVAEDDPVMSYATIHLVRSVPPAPYGSHLITLLVNGLSYTLMTLTGSNQTHKLRLNYNAVNKRVYAYVDGSLKKSQLWIPTMDFYLEVINVALGAGEVGPERSYMDMGPLRWDVTETHKNTEGWV